jgi:excinuclease ABC subunit B
MEGAHDQHNRRGRRTARVAESGARYADVTPQNLGRAIAELEKQMFTHAELLEFEEAASVRDEISKLKERVLK